MRCTFDSSICCPTLDAGQCAANGQRHGNKERVSKSLQKVDSSKADHPIHSCSTAVSSFYNSVHIGPHDNIQHGS